MSSVNNPPKNYKYRIFLHARMYDVPLENLPYPPLTGFFKEFIKIGFLEDNFKLYMVRENEDYLRVFFQRERLYPNQKLDDGYELLFSFIMTGQDEGTKVSFMKHDKDTTGDVYFPLSAQTLAKVKEGYLFEMLVIVEMMEIKSLEKDDSRFHDKARIDAYMSNMKTRLSEENARYLGYILRDPGLQDTFTGRLPSHRMIWAIYINAVAAINYSKVAKYVIEKIKASPSNIIPDVDVDWLLHYVVNRNKEVTLSHNDAILQKYKAHLLGLSYYKMITTDYLLKIMNEDYVVLDILAVSLLVRDDSLFEKAAVAFLNRYDEVTRSEKYRKYTKCKAQLMRFIMHSIRIWIMSKKDVHIPGWKVCRCQLPTIWTREL